MAYEKRFVDNLIGGMIIRIAKFGETVTAGNTVGEGAKPDAPTPGKARPVADPGQDQDGYQRTPEEDGDGGRRERRGIL